MDCRGLLFISTRFYLRPVGRAVQHDLFPVLGHFEDAAIADNEDMIVVVLVDALALHSDVEGHGRSVP